MRTLKRKKKKIVIGLKEKVQRLVRVRVRWRMKTLMMAFLWNQCLPHPMPHVRFTTLQGHVVLLGLKGYLPAEEPMVFEVLQVLELVL